MATSITYPPKVKTPAIVPPPAYDFSKDALQPNTGPTAIQMGQQAEQQMKDRVIAESRATPGKLATGAQMGAVQTGTEQTPITFQAFTRAGATPTPAPVAPAAPTNPFAAAGTTPGASEASASPGGMVYDASQGGYVPATYKAPDTTALDQQIADLSKGRSQAEIDASLNDSITGITSKYNQIAHDTAMKFQNAKAQKFSDLAGIGTGINPLSSGASSVAAGNDIQLDEANRNIQMQQEAEIAQARAAAAGEKTTSQAMQLKNLQDQRQQMEDKATKDYEIQRQSVADQIDQLNYIAKTVQMTDTQKGNAKTVIDDYFTAAGGSAYDDLDDVTKRTMEKNAGLPAGYITKKANKIKDDEITSKTKMSTDEMAKRFGVKEVSGSLYQTYTDPTTGETKVSTLVQAPEKKTNPFEGLPSSYAEWQLAGGQGSYGDWLRNGSKGGGKIVTIDGKNYLQNEDGTFTAPTLPDSVPSSEKVAKAQDIVTKIDDLLKNPNLSKAIGPVSSQIKEWMRTGARNDVDAAIDTLIAGMAMENLGLLKGPMSDKDVVFIKDATTGLKKNMSEAGFKAKLTELRNKFEEIKNKAASQPISPNGLQSSYEGAGFDMPYDQAVQTYGEEGLKQKLRDMGITVGFNTAPSMAQNYSNGSIAKGLGNLSSKYESGGDPGSIGYDNTGGLSYGTYQLAHSNAKKFVEQSPYAQNFKGLAFNTPQWQKRWKELAATDPNGFGQAQHDYIAKTHYDPQIQMLAQAGLKIDKISPTMQNVIWSTAVQHGPNNNIVLQALKNLGSSATESDLIKKIYALRWNGGKNFARSTADVKKGVYNRFFGPNGELASALRSETA